MLFFINFLWFSAAFLLFSYLFLFFSWVHETINYFHEKNKNINYFYFLYFFNFFHWLSREDVARSASHWTSSKKLKKYEKSKENQRTSTKKNKGNLRKSTENQRKSVKNKWQQQFSIDFPFVFIFSWNPSSRPSQWKKKKNWKKINYFHFFS